MNKRIENGRVEMSESGHVEKNVKGEIKDDKRVPRWMLAGGDKITAFVAHNDSGKDTEFENRDAFAISAGTERNTRGILFWNKPYVIRQSNGEKMCVLLMDTQGLWDRHTGNEFNCSIFGLSCLLSSYVIFNQKNDMNTNELKQFSVLTKFSKEVSKMGKPFQHLDILLRDYAGYGRNHDTQKGIEMSKERLKEMQSGGIEAPIAKGIAECFSEFDVFSFPTPGEDVMDLYYDGTIGDIKPLFMRMMSYYINRIIQGEIKPRVMGDVCITGRNFVG